MKVEEWRVSASVLPQPCSYNHASETRYGAGKKKIHTTPTDGDTGRDMTLRKYERKTQTRNFGSSCEL